MTHSINHLLRPVYNSSEQWFSKNLVQFAEFVTESLVDQAELSNLTSFKSNCFSAIHSIRSSTNSFIQAFLTALNKNFQINRNAGSSTHRRIKTRAEKTSLKLVATRDLEDNLSFETVVEKLSKQNKEAFEHLKIRIDQLLEDNDEHIRDNPLTAENIVSAFRESIVLFDFEPDIRIEVYKLFEQFVCGRIPELLKILNEQLINQGILPKIKTHYSIRKQPGNNTSGSPASSTPAESDSLPDNFADNNPVIESYTPDTGTSLHSTIPTSVQTSALTNRYFDLAIQLTRQQTNANEAASQLSPLLDHADLSSSNLSENNLLALKQAYIRSQERSQKQSISNLMTSAYSNQYDISTNDLINAVIDIKHHSIDSRENKDFSTTSVQKKIKENILSKADKSPETTQLKNNQLYLIDMIETLFDHIMDNKHLSSRAAYLFRSMIIPFIHLALVDDSFFDNTQHPARLFLDDFADADLGITDGDSTTNNPLYLKLSKLTTQLSNEDQINRSFFKTIHSDLKRFIEQRKQYANINNSASRRSVEQKVDAILTHCIKDKKLPDDINLLLNKVWKNVMVNIYFDENNDDWDKAVAFINAFLFSIQPADTPNDKKRLDKLIPILNHELENGLIRINYPPAIKAKLLQRLKKHHLTALGKVNISQAVKDNIAPQVTHSPAQNNDKHSEYNDIESFEKNLTPPFISNELETMAPVFEQKPELEITTAYETAIEESAQAPELETITSQLEKNHFEAIPDSIAEVIQKDNAPIKVSKTDFELIRLVNNSYKLKIISDQYTDAAKRLTVDAWLEFHFKSHNSRARVTWIKDDKSQFNCLTQNNRVIEMPLAALSDCFRQGISSVIESSSIIDKAIKAMSKDF